MCLKAWSLSGPGLAPKVHRQASSLLFSQEAEKKMLRDCYTTELGGPKLCYSFPSPLSTWDT